MRIIVIIFYLMLVLVSISFAALNASFVKVSFYFSTISMPISVLMILMLGIGIIFGCILSIFRYWRLKSESRKIKQQLKVQEQEIKNLRTIPVTDHYTGFGDR